MFCNQCGKKLNTAEKFCSQCGRKIEILKQNAAPIQHPPTSPPPPPPNRMKSAVSQKKSQSLQSAQSHSGRKPEAVLVPQPPVSKTEKPRRSKIKTLVKTVIMVGMMVLAAGMYLYLNTDILNSILPPKETLQDVLKSTINEFVP